MQPDVWTTRTGVSPLSDEVVGFAVEGRDGKIGKVDHVSYGGTCLVVSTGRLLGKKYVVPAWAVERTDPEEKTVLLDLTKDDVEGSPEYEDATGLDDDCEARVGAYYEDLVARR